MSDLGVTYSEFGEGGLVSSAESFLCRVVQVHSADREIIIMCIS